MNTKKKQKIVEQNKSTWLYNQPLLCLALPKDIRTHTIEKQLEYLTESPFVTHIIHTHMFWMSACQSAKRRCLWKGSCVSGKGGVFFLFDFFMLTSGQIALNRIRQQNEYPSPLLSCTQLIVCYFTTFTPLFFINTILKCSNK